MTTTQRFVFSNGSFSKERALATLKSMYQTRLMDDKMTKLVRQNKGGSFHLSVLGHEMIGAVAGKALTPQRDWGFPYYRDRAFALSLGCDPKEVLAAFLARELNNHSGGRMMPEHFSEKALNIPCQSSVVGSQFLQAVGVAKALQIQGKNDVVYVSAGDGATSQGDFHEALNFASLHQLGVIFVIQDNGWAISVPVHHQTAGGSIVKMAKGYEGLKVFDVDGTDYVPLAEAFDAAVERGRKNLGPSLIVAKVPRIGAHSSSDDPSKYKDSSHFALDKERDPFPRFEKWLLENKVLSEKDLIQMREDCFEETEKAALLADQYPHPNPQDAAKNVFKEYSISESEQTSSDSIVMMDAINHALDEEMRLDEKVVVFGQDVAYGKGGVFGITRGLTDKYGESRCFNTPLAESTIVALAIGMSFVEGFKPVAEIQFADYMWTGINQMFNELASMYYRSNGQWNCPVVLRMPYGGYIQGGPYHSQSVEAYLAHCPGLKVVIPSNASDAKRLLKAAIRDPNPVIFLEHKGLYRQRVFSARNEPSDQDLLPFGKAKVVRDGKDVTLVTYGMMTCMAADVAEKLSQEGVDVEVIDLRTIVPLDIETVLASVKKTGKVLIAHEAVENCGFGAEIAARICDQGFEYLDAPIKRIAALNCVVPYSKVLEDEVLPQKKDIEEALRNLSRF